MKAIKRSNKKLDICTLCAIELKADKENRTKWIGCYRCGAWSCYGCLPQRFQRASAEVYNCDTCTRFIKDDEESD